MKRRMPFARKTMPTPEQVAAARAQVDAWIGDPTKCDVCGEPATWGTGPGHVTVVRRCEAHRPGVSALVAPPATLGSTVNKTRLPRSPRADALFEQLVGMLDECGVAGAPSVAAHMVTAIATAPWQVQAALMNHAREGRLLGDG